MTCRRDTFDLSYAEFSLKQLKSLLVEFGMSVDYTFATTERRGHSEIRLQVKFVRLVKTKT